MASDSSSKKAILVLGMHRSGTSLAAGLMEAIGLSVPDDLMDPTPDNLKGYWESKSLMAIHDRILLSARMQWSDTFLFPKSWQATESYQSAKKDLQEFVQDKLVDSDFFVLKDPRMCRLAALWLDVLGSLHIEPHVLIPCRCPHEVALSLQARDGLDIDSGYFLWQRHVLEAELLTRDVSRSFIDYAQLLDNPHKALEKIEAELGVVWPRMDKDSVKRVEQLTDPSLKHQSQDALDKQNDKSIFANLANDTYDAIKLLCENSSDTKALSLLDDLRTRIEAADDLYEPIIMAQLQEKEDVRGQLKDKEQEVQQLGDWAHQLEKSKKHFESQNISLNERNTSLAEKVTSLEIGNNKLEVKNNILEVKNNTLEVKNNTLEVKHDALVSVNTELKSELSQLGNELFQKEAQVTKESLEKRELGLAYFLAKRNLNQSESSQGSLSVWDASLKWISQKIGRKNKGYVEPMADIVRKEFDHNFYRSNNSDLNDLSDQQLLDHYLNHGWKEHRWPNNWFDTQRYLEWFPELIELNACPFTHFIRHTLTGQASESQYLQSKLLNFQSGVTAIIPNFNHAEYLPERIRSVVNQSVPPSEIIILDDCSTDNSLAVIEQAIAEIDIPCKILANDLNSGNVFKQWRKGIDEASYNLIWICESDDFCELDFLEKMSGYFADPSVKFAFGNIQFVNQDGSVRQGMDDYRKGAYSQNWEHPRVDSAQNWFNQALGQRNVAANVGGCLFRKQNLDDVIWQEAEKYHVCGDWYLYMHLAKGGRVAYEPSAVAYFRQHDRNTSVTSFQSDSYYKEHAYIATELRCLYQISDDHVQRFYAFLNTHFENQYAKEAQLELKELFDMPFVLEAQNQNSHILMGILGFSTGGGELFPINLANELVNRGHQVSVVTVDSRFNEEAIRNRLDARIAIYERELVDEMGREFFLTNHGFDLIHTHFLGVDLWLHKACQDVGLPYIVTHHGSYDFQEIPQTDMQSLINTVDQWVYIADKNLNVFEGYELDHGKTTKLPNAVPDAVQPFKITREDLGIEQNAFVFGLASRAMEEKGWPIAAEVIVQIQNEFPDRDVHLLLCGNGRDYDALSSKYGNYPGVHFLGYQENIIGFYELCDCCLFPTRFKGESYPLTLIESMMAGIPAIATNIGEIANIVSVADRSCGYLVELSEDDKEFQQSFVKAMRKMLDSSRHEKLCKDAKAMAKNYSMASLAESYEELYLTIINRLPK